MNERFDPSKTPLLRQAANNQISFREVTQVAQARRELREQVTPLMGGLRRQIDRFITKSFDGVNPEIYRGIPIAGQGRQVTGEIDVDGEKVKVVITEHNSLEDQSTYVDLEALPERLVMEPTQLDGDFYIESKERDESKPVLVGGRVPHARRDVTVEDIENYGNVIKALSSPDVQRVARYFKSF